MIEKNKNVGNAKAKKEIVKRVQSTKPSMEQMEQLADLFKVFGDSTRIKIIYTIYQKELCVHDIARIIQMTHSSVSHQLKNLKQARLVKSRKDGKEVYYTLDDEHIEKIFQLGLKHIEEV